MVWFPGRHTYCLLSDARLQYTSLAFNVGMSTIPKHHTLDSQSNSVSRKSREMKAKRTPLFCERNCKSVWNSVLRGTVIFAKQTELNYTKMVVNEPDELNTQNYNSESHLKQRKFFRWPKKSFFLQQSVSRAFVFQNTKFSLLLLRVTKFCLLLVHNDSIQNYDFFCFEKEFDMFFVSLKQAKFRRNGRPFRLLSFNEKYICYEKWNP
jgi:hypothetical protein